MAVKHPVVECVESNAEARLSNILRQLRNITTEHNLKEIELQRICETIVYKLGTVAMPTKTDEYVKFMSDIQSVQDILKIYAKNNVIFPTLKALYNAISDPQKPRHPTMSIVLELISVESIPGTVKYILRAGTNEHSLEEALMTLCNWLSHWTVTKNLGPLVLHFMAGLEDEQHYDILIEVTLRYVEKLFKLLVLPESRETVGPVVLHMLQRMQHSPAAFHKILYYADKVFEFLEREDSQSSRWYLNELVNLCAALMEHFPGYAADYEPLKRSLERFDVRSNYRDALNCRSWIDTSSATIATRLPNGKVGLNNLGNTCYMNSVLQALFMTKSFRNDLLLSGQNAPPLFAKLQALFALLQHSQRTSMSPNDILNVAKPPGFQIGQQHDSSEFLGYLLDILHEQEQYLATNGRIQGNNAPETTATMVQRSFGGRAVTVSRCVTCGMQSEREDNFRELQLSFPSHGDNQTVQSLVDYYLQPEKLCGDNQYHCDRCHGLTDGERVTRVMEPPRRLVLTLKHFRYDPASQQRTKLLQSVNLDSSITLQTDSSVGGVQYELYAAVLHYGSNLDSGHYYTFAKDDGQEWYKFNDCIVSRTSAEELCSVQPPETPYILFYRQEDFGEPEPLARSALGATLENILQRDQSELDVERRRRTHKVTFRRNPDDEPPPPGCGGSFINTASNRYVC